jgi:hypothetical protein
VPDVIGVVPTIREELLGKAKYPNVPPEFVP